MNYERLLQIEKPFFSHEEVAHALNIQPASAAVLCSRYAKKGLLTRLKRGLYLRTETLRYLEQTDIFRIANFLQVPSYISLLTALSFYGISTQVQRGFIECISVKRTRAFQVREFSFHYVKLKPDLYGGFVKREGYFIALPEKAVLDACYLASAGRYAFDIPSLDFTKFNKKVLTELSVMYPLKTIKFLERHYAKIK